MANQEIFALLRVISSFITPILIALIGIHISNKIEKAKLLLTKEND